MVHKCSLTKQTNTNIKNLKKPKNETSNTIFRWKKVLKKEMLINYSLSRICNVSVLEFWTEFNKWYTSWIQDKAIKWSPVWALFFNFSQNPIRDQDSSQFSLWLLQWTVFVLVCFTRKNLNSLHIFLCGMRSCES